MLLTLSLLLTPPAHASIGAAIVLSLELPVVARDLRLGGIPPAEVRAVIVGSRERHLGGEELHADDRGHGKDKDKEKGRGK